MSLRTQMIIDLSCIFNTDEHAENLTYNGESIVGIFELHDTTPGMGADARLGKLYVRMSDFASAPSYRDVIIRASDSVQFEVYKDENDREYYESEGVYIINIYEDERVGLDF